MWGTLLVGLAMVQSAPDPLVLRAAQATYVGVFREPVTLVAGRHEGQDPATGGRRQVRVSSSLRADLDGDGRSEEVVVLWTRDGDHEPRWYLAVLVLADGVLRNSATAAVGDRLQAVAIRTDGNRIVLDTTVPGPRGRVGAAATRQVTRLWVYADGALVEAEGMARH